MGNDTGSFHYLELKSKICEKIYEGIYKNNERIPSERQLSEEYALSRITVRKTLDILEQEHLIKREVGNGTIVTLKNEGNAASLDVIALVAHSKSTFFAGFITAFEKYIWERDCLLLYVEVPQNSSIEDCLYRLYCKDIKTAVVWVDDQSIDQEKILRLRSIGMNMVFFDTDIAHPFADSVLVDNEEAVRTLLESDSNREGATLYIGWDNLLIGNIRKREEIFRKLCPEGKVFHVPWSSDRSVDRENLRRTGDEILSGGYGHIIFGTGDVGEQIFEELKMRDTFYGNGLKYILDTVSIGMIDASEGMSRYGVRVYDQDLKETAKQIFSCFERQIEEGKNWEAQIFQISGRLQ